MRNILAKLTVPLICSAIVFSGCGTAGTRSYTGTQGNTLGNANVNSGAYLNGTKSNSTNLNSTNSANLNRTNVNSTNQNGTNVNSPFASNSTNSRTKALSTQPLGGIDGSGIGPATSARYGGSSPFTGDGVSTSLENELAKVGFAGSRVLALDDTVILGLPLSGNSGTPNNNGAIGARGHGHTDSNVTVAKSRINRLMGGVRVLTVSDPEALRAMERVRNSLHPANGSNKASVSSDLDLILKSAKETGQSGIKTGTGTTNGVGSGTGKIVR